MLRRWFRPLDGRQGAACLLNDYRRGKAGPIKVLIAPILVGTIGQALHYGEVQPPTYLTCTL